MKRGQWKAYNPPCPLTLSTRDKTKARIELQRLPCDKASEMLGINLHGTLRKSEQNGRGITQKGR
jgi:hypothetical protein